jgi:ribosomal protein S18 acetylase RimI-like enzyme
MPDMLVKLYDIPPLTPYFEILKVAGVMVRTARAYEKHQVLAWVERNFGSGWASECDVAFSNRPISCFLAIENHTIVGFACYESTWKNFFGPMGVAPHARNRGIGTALLLVCLHAMAAHGYVYAIIGSAGALAFYNKTVGAIPIEGSEPGAYGDRLQKPGN